MIFFGNWFTLIFINLNLKALYIYTEIIEILFFTNFCSRWFLIFHDWNYIYMYYNIFHQLKRVTLVLAGSLSARQLLKWQVTIIVLLCLTWVACPSSQSPLAPQCDCAGVCSERESAGDSYLRMRCRRQLPKGLAVTQEINIISFQIQAAGQIRYSRAGRGATLVSESLSLPFRIFSAKRTRRSQSDGKSKCKYWRKAACAFKEMISSAGIFLPPNAESTIWPVDLFVFWPVTRLVN